MYIILLCKYYSRYQAKYIIVIYHFFYVLYEFNIHCFLLSIQITVVSTLGKKKINVLFPETSEYFLGSVGRHFFYFKIIFYIRKA